MKALSLSAFRTEARKHLKGIPLLAFLEATPLRTDAHDNIEPQQVETLTKMFRVAAKMAPAESRKPLEAMLDFLEQHL